jgi:hypothetical protein
MKFPKLPWQKNEDDTATVPALLIVLFAVSLLWVYAWPNMFGERGAVLRERMPYPLVVISPRQVITYGEYAENSRAVKRFYESQDFSQIGLRVDLHTEEGQKRFMVRKKEVLNKMIEDEALRYIAKNENIVVTKDMAREGVRRSLEEYGTSERVQSDLDRLYGFTLAQFEDKVVMPKLYQEKVLAFFEETMKPGEGAQNKIDNAKKMLDQGKNFAEVAKEFSEGETRESGGDLGWFQLTDLAPELQSVVPTQTVGIAGSVVESSLGYHIVMLEEIKKEEGKTLYRISQIFTRKDSFTDWLTKKMQDMPIHVLSPEYRFNGETAQVEFKSESMRQFEKELFNTSEGDALFLF